MKWSSIAAAVVFLSTSALAATGTWTGELTSSACVGKHTATFHGKTESARECAQDCIKEGAKYVFVSEGKVFQLANQSSKQIAPHAGQQVELTGTLKGDTITAKQMKATK